MSKPIKRGDKWRMQIMINGVRESATFDTKREALAWADQRRMELRGGATPSTSRTLHQMIDKYISEVAPLRRGGEFEIKRLRLMKDRLRDSRLDAMSAETFSKWRDARLQEVSAGTVLRDMGVLRSVFSCARRDWGWKFEDVLKDVRRPPAPPSRDRLITAQEIAIMLDRLNYSPDMKATLKSQQTAVAFIIALLGKISDYDLARMRGVSKAAVFLKRQTLGIPPMERKQQLLGEWPNLVNIPQSEFIKKCCKHADIDYKTLAARCYVSYSRIQKWAAPGNGQEPLSMAYRRLIFLETHS